MVAASQEVQVPPDSLVFPARLRHAATIYALVAAPLCALAAWTAEGPDEYVRAMSLTSVVYTIPGAVLAVVASLRAAPGDRLIWRLWSIGWVLGGVAAVAYLTMGPSEEARDMSVGRSVAGLCVLVVANMLMLRRRVGERAAIVDAIDILMATIAVTLPLALLMGDRIVEAEHSWFTISSALWWIVALHGLFVALVMRARVPPEGRATSHLGILLALAGMTTSTAGLVHGLRDFRAPSGPAMATYALFLAILTLFFLSSTRYTAAGLERLPAASQVRRQSFVLLGVLAVVPVVAVEAWMRRDETWVVAMALTSVATLLVLSSIRHLLSARETIRLYSAVERAADDRGALLGEVVAHGDVGRHRIAAHLHRQAVSLYTSVATLTCALDTGTRTEGSSERVTIAAEQLRRDLKRRADDLQALAVAVKPMARGDAESPGLSAPLRAFVETLYNDCHPPEFDVSVDPALVLDWTTEAILMRIAQEAIGNVYRHSRATAVQVRLDVDDGALRFEIEDDGVGDDRIHEHEQRGVASMRSMARFLNGELTVTSVAGVGTLVSATFALDPLPERPRPALHLVADRSN
jgi:signal transduction histidine kinase